ncbi:RagB/SusD family nutrient uptake outer membrane protein [Marinilabiliaceae bacterium JC017]|nr:RagB/SusD family nutrient uptake outer membrane protein [Marinilabiliaceae bacterium JC017]
MNKLSILLFIVSVFFTACDDKLELTPYDGLTDDQLFATADGFETAIKGVYSGFRDYGYYGESKGIMIGPDIIADNLMYNKAGRQTQRSLFEWRNTAVDESFGLYERGYKIISRANRILDNIEKLKEGDFRNNIEAEAKAIRALVHFDIARTYCKIPTQNEDANASLGIAYVETFDPSATPRRQGNTVSGTYTKIVNDLLAASKINEDNGEGRLGKAAISGILSRVYLHMGDYAKANQEADKVIAMGVPVAKREDFGNIWIDSYKKNILFEIRITDQDRVRPGVSYSQDAQGEIKSEYVVSYPLYLLYSDADIRKSTTIQTSDFKENTYNHVAKYLGRATGDKNVIDGKYLRMAEVYLNKAEALAEDTDVSNDGDALKALDAVRSQRYSPFVSGNETGQALKDAIQLERRLELAFEGDRFYTLKRRGEGVMRSDHGEWADGTGTPPVVKELKASSFRWQLPIPQGAIDANPELKEDQNPGY